MPNEVEHRSLTALGEKPVKIGAKVGRHGRTVTVEMADVAVRRDSFRKILRPIVWTASIRTGHRLNEGESHGDDGRRSVSERDRIGPGGPRVGPPHPVPYLQASGARFPDPVGSAILGVGTRSRLANIG